MKTAKNIVVAVFENRDQAQFAVWDLVNCGFPNETVSVRTTEVERHAWGEEGESVVVKESAKRIPDNEGSREYVYQTVVPMGPGDMPALAELGIPEPQARFFVEKMQQGGFLVTVSTEEFRAGEAEEIMRRHDGVDRDERMETRLEESTAFEGTSRTGTGAASRTETEAGVPLSRATLEEQLQRAKVFGGAEAEAARPDISAMDDEEFQRHFRQTYGERGKRFDEPYRSAYHFAEAESAAHPQFAGKEWFEVEEAIHRDWEETHPGTWKQVEDAIHFGWNTKQGH